MQKVTTIKPLPDQNRWSEFLEMEPESKQQEEFLRRELNEGRLSRVRMGNCSIFSDSDQTSYNPKLGDEILYFIFEKDAKDFVKAKGGQLLKNFFWARLCIGKCHCKNGD
ncbi:hypothetical protein M0Q50_00660 [bacterium]|nr:hypothetical protein [bacterium]